MNRLPAIDVAVLVVYLIGSVALGAWFVRKNRGASDFVSARGALPGWLVGLSVFGTYVSSISFLALPGKALVSNWNAFAFTLSLPLAAFLSVRYFVPFYRRQGEVSAYGHLERRFGVWARVYANVCYLLTHVARMAAVMFLLAKPLNQLLGWDVRLIILLIGALTTFYTCLGGIEGVIWTDAAQSLVLITGAVTCAILLPLKIAGGPAELFHLAAAHHKFDLGGFAPSFTSSTFWVVFAYGLFTNLANFGVDQTFVQRYHTASSDREAAKSVWVGALTYLPVSAMFLFIGTGLFAFYTASPELLPERLRADVAAGRGDDVFPWFIVHALPTGVTGLLIAAVFAGAMSTLSSNLNSAATLTLSDFYKRFLRPTASDRESMAVLYLGTLLWGVIGTGTALAMIHVKSVLDAWWEVAGLLGAGTLGLFLLGRMSRRASRPAGIVAVVVGVIVVLWMFSSQKPWWPGSLAAYRNPLHAFMVIVIGTSAVLGIGLLVTRLTSRRDDDGDRPTAVPHSHPMSTPEEVR
jgi:SSS family solute:Na+ symporter